MCQCSSSFAPVLRAPSFRLRSSIPDARRGLFVMRSEYY